VLLCPVRAAIVLMLLDSDVQIATIAAYNFSIAYENSVIDVRVLACSRVSCEAPSSLLALRCGRRSTTSRRSCWTHYLWGPSPCTSARRWRLRSSMRSASSTRWYCQRLRCAVPYSVRSVSLTLRVVDGFGRRSTASSLGARWQAWTTQHCRSGTEEMPVTVAAVVLQ
jgi:hypothetical protein